ncbi:DUF7344 domain-containing protein [Natrinema amylolyticum]|uniref:DUF7344 domain-containing protein n=1 Tax=Natrinema amylolyticum TaxID=2878679 RepID=UPI001CFBD411|nr:hypothetical protein [Natrinema amylolyticum]
MGQPMERAAGRERKSGRTATGTDRAVLGDRRRACILSHLVNMEESTAERSELAEEVRRDELKNPDESEQPTRESIEIDLHHNQLPRLEDAGFIEYHRRQGTVRYDGLPDQRLLERTSLEGISH